ncbi:MAG: hypothetical protein FJX80_05465 [Bacteroidetes bacterium]|nr:hypothetical protein [Bacteroidota bacterium]
MSCFGFQPIALSEWKEKIRKELGENSHNLFYKNELELLDVDITYKDYHAKYKTNCTNNANSTTKNAVSIDVNDEKEANRLALYCLNFGADALFFSTKKTTIKWDIVLEGIELDYIQSWFQLESQIQFDELFTAINVKSLSNITIIAPFNSLRNFHFNAFYWQQIGAPSYLEIGFLIYELNHCLIKLDKNQIELSSFIFTLGLDGNYFIDMAKIRAAKYLVHYLLESYEVKPKQIEFHAHVGWSNKSLRDKDINLLRQTTEVMAAYASNVDAIFNNPSTKLSTMGASDVDWRLSLNIMNILTEESYLGKVTNPLDGAYVHAQMVDQLIDLSWNLFTNCQELSKEVFYSVLKDKTVFVREEKRKQFTEKAIRKIGINAFESAEVNQEYHWGKIPKFCEIPYLILEKEF